MKVHTAQGRQGSDPSLVQERPGQRGGVVSQNFITPQPLMGRLDLFSDQLRGSFPQELDTQSSLLKPVATRAQQRQDSLGILGFICLVGLNILKK